MHTELNFAVEPKQGSGKGVARKARAAGKTPGVVYGPEMEPVMVSFLEKDLVKALSTPAKRNMFLRLQSSDQQVNGVRVMVKDLQVDPVRREFIHADFYKLDPNRMLQTTVPIQIEGTAIGVKLGGILQVARQSIQVSCLPDDLPDAILVDVTELVPGASIHVRDLSVPKGVEILSAPELAVCAIMAPSAIEAEEEEVEEEVVEEAAEGEED